MALHKEQEDFKSIIESAVTASNELPVTPQKQLLPLTNLDWKLFEQLCCRLVAHEPDTEGTPYLYGVPGEDQKGIDIVAKKRIAGSLQTWCYQCKDYQHFSPSDFIKAIKSLEYKADHYIFLIACEADTHLQTIADENGLEIWDVRIISSKLKYHPDLVADFFGFAWKSAFCIPRETANLSVLDIYRPPKPKQPFIGREAELDILCQHLSKQRVIIIEGIGGIGKTETLLQALETVNDIPTVWLDVESYKSISDLRQAILRTFSKEGSTLRTEQELFAYLDSQSIRIIFDGLDRIAVSEWDSVIDFLSLLTRSTRQPKFVVTSQIEASNLEFEAFRLSLNALKPEASKYLLSLAWEKLQQVRVNEADVDWLVQLCDGHPLSLRLVMGLLRYHRNTRVVVDRLRSVGADELKDPNRKQQKSSTALKVCLEAVYAHFDHQQKRLLLFISNFPIGCIDWYAQRFQENENYEINLAELRRFFFIVVREDPIRPVERFYILNPIKLFIKDRWQTEALTEAIEIQLAAGTKLMVQIAATSQIHLDSNITDLGLSLVDYDLPNYEAAVQNAIKAMKRKNTMGQEVRTCLKVVMYIAYGLYPYFFVRVFQPVSIPLIQAGIDAAEQLGSDYFSIVTKLYNVLFCIKQRLHDYKGCEEVIERMTIVAQKTDDPEVKALSSMTLGDFALQHRQFGKSIEHYKVGEAFYESALYNAPPLAEKGVGLEGASYYKAMLGIAKSCLGHAYEYQGHHQKAVVSYLEAVNCFFETQDNLNIGSVYHQLGNCYAYMGEFAKALDYYTQAVECFAPLKFGQFLSNSMSELGLVALETEFPDFLKESLGRDLILMGLEDVRRELESFIGSDKGTLFENAMFPVDTTMLLQKVLGILVLCSFTDHKASWETWAGSFLNEVVIPEIDAISARLKQIDKMDYFAYSQYWTFLYEVHILLQVANYIGQTSSNGNQEQEKYISVIYDLCEDLHEPFSDRVFQWLEKVYHTQ